MAQTTQKIINDELYNWGYRGTDYDENETVVVVSQALLLLLSMESDHRKAMRTFVCGFFALPRAHTTTIDDSWLIPIRAIKLHTA